MIQSRSAKSLLGNCLVLTIFLSEGDTPWESDMKDAIYEMIYQAEEWLVFQAERFGISLDFENLQFGHNEDIVIDHIPNCAVEDHDPWLFDLCEKLDYRSLEEMLQELHGDERFDNILVLIIASRNGMSCTLPFAYDVDRDCFHEAAMVCRQDDSAEINTATIAHEMLRLFGACDLSEKGSAGSRVEKVRARFHDEIMLQLEDDIYDNNISELTAYRIGWHGKYKKWYGV